MVRLLERRRNDNGCGASLELDTRDAGDGTDARAVPLVLVAYAIGDTVLLGAVRPGRPRGVPFVDAPDCRWQLLSAQPIHHRSSERQTIQPPVLPARTTGALFARCPGTDAAVSPTRIWSAATSPRLPLRCLLHGD